jgi:SAM-dependent methyltransferase
VKGNGAELFLRALEKKARLLAPGARASVEANRELCAWLLDPLAEWAQAAYGEEIFGSAARGYAQYCYGVAKSQKVYESVGAYSPEAMPEIMSAVYENEGQMIPYMWAAILIYAFWPSMAGHLALFRDEFLRRLPKGARMLEVASGHGVLSLLAAQERPDLHIEGVDISPPAVAVSNHLLAVSGHIDRVSFSVKDALSPNGSFGGEKYQGILSAMLAEHLPDPQPLFHSIARRLAPDGLVFFSTAIESPQRDHVFEFNWESQPLRMAEAVGMRATRLVSDAGSVTPGSRFSPRATAMILRLR